MKEYMNSRERVLATINHQKSDRVPFDYAAKDTVTKKLQEYLGLDSCDAVLEYLHIDMRRICGNDLWSYVSETGNGYQQNLFGFRWAVGASPVLPSLYPSPIRDDITLNELWEIDWSVPDEFTHPTVMDQCRRFHDDYITYGSPWCPFFHEVGWLLGEERFLRWLIEKPDHVHFLIDRFVDLHLESCRRFFDCAKGKLDIAYFGNDYGTQNGLLISPQTWHTFFRMPQKKFFDLAKDYRLKVMFHSCGSIRKIIPWLMEDGVDILDPIQSAAHDMDVLSLLNQFGSGLTLHGGVDTQHTLPFGSVGDVRAEVALYLEQTKDTGGYILCSSQKLLDDVPLENILAMYSINF